jgi:hypothetical protein
VGIRVRTQLENSKQPHKSRKKSFLVNLERTEWDLVDAGEDQEISADFFGTEIKETKRYQTLDTHSILAVVVNASCSDAIAGGALVPA